MDVIKIALLLIASTVSLCSCIEIEEGREGRGLEWLNPLSWFNSRSNDRQLDAEGQLQKRRLALNSAEEPTFIVLDPKSGEGRKLEAPRPRRPNDKMASYFKDEEPQQTSPSDYFYDNNFVETSRLDMHPFFEVSPKLQKHVGSDCVCRCDCCDCCPCSEDRMDLVLVD